MSDIFPHLPENRVEYHRNAVALVPEPDDPDPGLAVMVIGGSLSHGCFCDCRKAGKKKSCVHVKALSAAVKKSEISGTQDFDARFRQSLWHRLAAALNDACPVSPEALCVVPEAASNDNGAIIRVTHADKTPLVTCLPAAGRGSPDDQSIRLAQRTGIAPPDSDPHHRGRILAMLSRLTLTDAERVLAGKKMKSRRQALEESFWYRLAYHFGNEYGVNGTVLTAEIDEENGCFSLQCRNAWTEGIDILVPADAVLRVRQFLKDLLGDRSAPLWPNSLESIVKVTADKNNDLILTLCLLLHLPDGSTEIYERRKLKHFEYKGAFYIPDKNVLATWRTPDALWNTFGGKFTKKIKRDRLPEIIEKIGNIFAPPNIIDDRVQQLQIHRDYDRIEIDPAAIDRDWCWLSIRYRFNNNISVSLFDIYRARSSKSPYLPVADGWVDARAIDITPMTGFTGGGLSARSAASEETLQVSRLDLMRLQATLTDKPIVLDPSATGPDAQVVQSILDMRPPVPEGDLDALASPLRGYQRTGAGWLAFLHENRLGGLLCDDMGLGKTHQIMALMSWLAETKTETAPFLVVCPTTVLSHWERKIREHAPALCPTIYHGTDRELDPIKKPGQVLITSYGILLRDCERLSRLHFSVAAFDEAQHLKNPGTKSYGAAEAVNAALKIAVTGTPIENRLEDLKALMDIVLPGFLGTDSAFRDRFVSGGRERREELRRLVRPFTLRRTKSAVLSELPEKIEDIRFCRLSDTQAKLYREAIDSRAGAFLRDLENDEARIDYIHIFALLTLLKQICNHPASISRNTRTHYSEPTASGKWDLFAELLEECLENGQKVVVFSQFVAMIDLIAEYLDANGIGHAVLTGQTQNRSKQIDRFNNDPDCRVFVGSLKAGGTGIDLTAGSVVIHYDRWWNAAKEDQATDRVHRIGQTRGVQVFKLVTEGTLEEKIAAIISRKKNLMADVISEDDPGLLKTFTRKELVDLLTLPDAED